MLRALMVTLALFGAALASPAAAQALHPLPPQPEGVAWPTQRWPAAPLPRDVDRAAFDLAITEAFAGHHDLLGDTRAVLIVQSGQLVFERYGEGYGPESRFVSWSMAKSITQALVGVAVRQGRVAIDTPMGNPHWPASDRRAAISWRYWLNMVDGQRYLEIGAPDPVHNNVAHMLYGRGRLDTAAYAAGLPLAHDPGTHWNYNSAGVALISDALTRAIVASPRDAADRRGRMRAWMQQGLFAPIGMHPLVEFDAAGSFYGSSLVFATGQDFARFGYLYLRDGAWDGRRVLPEGWVDFARTPGPDANTDIYGAGWWLTPPHGTGRPLRSLITDERLADAFSAQGHEGQIIVVVPSRDLVLVRLGRFEERGGSWDALGDWATRVVAAFGERRSANEAAN
jgi:CubicO group peptidase (beta-lactamase class C family)